MATALIAMPKEITAGTTVKYARAFADYPAGTWTLTVYLAGAKVLSKAGVQNGTGFDVTLTPAETDLELSPGVYRWVERVANAGTGEVYDAASGSVEVLPNISQAQAGVAPTIADPGSPGTQQSLEEYQLQIVNLALSGRLAADMESYQIAGRAVSKIPYLELVKIKASLLQQVRQQKNPGMFSTPVRIQFGGVAAEK